jgi:hypothetical protein
MRRVIALLLIAVVLSTGCMSAPRTISSPRTFIPMNRPDRVWLTDAEGMRMEVTRPRILPGDTLFGRSRLGEEIWIPLNSIQRIQARELDRKKTLMVVGGTVAAAAVFFAIAAGGGGGIDRDTGDRPEMSIILFRGR